MPSKKTVYYVFDDDNDGYSSALLTKLKKTTKKQFDFKKYNEKIKIDKNTTLLFFVRLTGPRTVFIYKLDSLKKLPEEINKIGVLVVRNAKSLIFHTPNKNEFGLKKKGIVLQFAMFHQKYLEKVNEKSYSRLLEFLTKEEEEENDDDDEEEEERKEKSQEDQSKLIKKLNNKIKEQAKLIKNLNTKMKNQKLYIKKLLEERKQTENILKKIMNY